LAKGFNIQIKYLFGILNLGEMILEKLKASEKKLLRKHMLRSPL